MASTGASAKRPAWPAVLAGLVLLGGVLGLLSLLVLDDAEDRAAWLESTVARPAVGELCAERTALYLDDWKGDPSVLDDLVLHEPRSALLQYPTPQRVVHGPR